MARAEKNGTTWDYTYNADGLRTSKSNGTETWNYVYNGSQLTQMTKGDDTLYFTYDTDGTPLTVTHNGTKYNYITNIQGDVVALLNAFGTTSVSYTYDAWGNLLSPNNSTLGQLNPLRYRGYVYDQESGLYYLQSRYYDPEIGRFINADAFPSTGQGFVGNNMFAYCNNNPVNLCDPNGMCSRFLGFLWKVDCGKATCPQSKNYNPLPPKAAVLYDSRTSGYLGGLVGGQGFKVQGEGLTAELQRSHQVDEYAFTSMDGFVDAWNSLDENYDRVYVLSHGFPGGLSCAGQSISCSGQDEYNLLDLKPASVTTMYLYSCNGATMSGNSSVAYSFAKLTGGSVWAVANGSLNYIYGTHIPLPAPGAVWSVTYDDMTTIWN